MLLLLACGVVVGCGQSLIVQETQAPSQVGTIVFVSARDGNDEIYRMQPDGSGQTRLTNNTTRDYAPAWSPVSGHVEGTNTSTNARIAFASHRDGNTDIYIMHADGSNLIRLTTHAEVDDSPAWSPDGTQLAFVSHRDGNPEIYVMPVPPDMPAASGSGSTSIKGKVVRLTKNAVADGAPTWSPDGTNIAFSSFRSENHDIYVMNRDGSEQINLTMNPGRDLDPAWSPDGTQIAFCSFRGRQFDIYVMYADGSEQTNVTPNAMSGMAPVWSPDGASLAFHSFQNGKYSIYTMNTDGSGQTLLTGGETFNWEPSWGYSEHMVH